MCAPSPHAWRSWRHQDLATECTNPVPLHCLLDLSAMRRASVGVEALLHLPEALPVHLPYIRPSLWTCYLVDAPHRPPPDLLPHPPLISDRRPTTSTPSRRAASSSSRRRTRSSPVRPRRCPLLHSSQLLAHGHRLAFAAIQENASSLQTADITQMPEQYASPAACAPCACAPRWTILVATHD